MIVELLNNYGPAGVENFKPFFGEVEKLMASNVSTIRADAMNLVKEVYKWMGELIRPFVMKLKKAQIDEIEKFIQEWPKTPLTPQREDFVTKVILGGKKPMGPSFKGGANEVKISKYLLKAFFFDIQRVGFPWTKIRLFQGSY